LRRTPQQALQCAGRVSAVRARLHNTILRATVALLLGIASVCLLSACGGSSQSAESLLSDTFNGHRRIESGNLNLALVLGASGSHTATKSLSVRLGGPFENESAAGGQLPRFALKLDLDAAGHGLQAGATSTGSALFVDLAGSWFSTPASTFKAIRQGYAQATKGASAGKVRSTFASLGVEPGHWLSDPVEVGTATVGGVQTIHLTATVNVADFLANVSKLSQGGGALGLGSSVPGVGSPASTTLSELAKSVKSAHVDIYTGKSDHLLRRLELDASLTGTPRTQAILGGLSSAAIKATLELSDLNKPQTIAAPSNPEPFSQLLPALQQLLGTLSSTSAGTSNGVLETFAGKASP
jgi:hypothetical protein